MADFNSFTTPPPAPEGVPSAEEKQWAMFSHLSMLLGCWVGGVGFFLGPFIIWMIKKDTMPFVSDQAKEALNFSITVAMIFAALWILVVVTFGIGFFIAVPVMGIVGVAALVLCIMAAMKANEGYPYRYPFALRLIK